MTTAAAAFLLAGCGGGGQPQTQDPASASPGSTVSLSISPEPTSSGAAPSPIPVPASSAAPAPDPGATRCTTETLSAATDSTGGGAAGSVYMTLLLTNTGAAPCILMGYPGVSLTAGPDGEPIGAPAVRDESKAPVELRLAPGESGGAQLRYVQARNFPECAVADAAGYRIYPPEDFGSLFIPQPTLACSDAKTELLTIGAFQPVA